MIQLAIIGAAGGSQIVTVFHFQVGTARETTLISDQLARAAGAELANDWLTTMKTPWLSVKPAEYALTMVRAQVLERPGQYERRLTPSELNVTTANTGVDVNGVEDYSTAVVARWRTDIAGKRHRGRTYIGPLASDQTVQGRAAAAAVTAIVAMLEVMKNRWAVGGTDHDDFALTIYSRPYDQGDYGYVVGSGSAREMFFPVDYAGDATNITDYSVDSVLRTQRRRQLGVGS